jgi:hypothetical protein
VGIDAEQTEPLPRRDTTPSSFKPTSRFRAHEGAAAGPQEAGEAGEASDVGAGREPLRLDLPFIWLG